MSETLRQRWERVCQQVDAACRDAGRDPGGVRILPVSKTFGPEVIREAVGLGLHRFGENKVQEIREKSEPLADCGINWVMIGHLQTNKANLVARLADELQSLDRPKLAAALDRRLQQEGRSLDVLVQVKTADEPSKYGLPPDQLPAFLDQLGDYPTLRVRGLMTMALHTTDPEAVRGCFRRLRELRDRAVDAGHALPELSMGMSGDFPLAIAEGATQVRIGTAIFGPRPYPDSYYWPEGGGAPR
ncbi:YggS family pyridoxal phosphate-dependent enzyme [Mycobacterium koreense]|uniref:Pyridoxal phosphate homeostasis protein n=1 Tax=Mycolicibacillus koreensis TaxID=1069220 RepID=A0A7I7SF89_9MYCO|nr:YggS family pyridoxal phosphate-dependent enzyme [Mycolicibacillus koreensis]MCV7250250.1 YggS family pyridoxal phosphate-dependent enzyme [Mycolicibacillus koreensis]ODR11122.1 YggS family pyridoxal phosphate enzyme [Mycolicibacillus koreensis]OSC32628.1 YggS family pyridoxal phosphate enzyme [Mycolicibacillus koreensis]BBY54899.1 YggS family pyridoxal phosphate enzyme [Mycolicibacillus koreensis]